ncbi:hypothetical protein H6A64_07980 [Lacrimispora saccharolytica]|nr:hypothetical protein [Lacrimispora saccharolytica]
MAKYREVPCRYYLALGECSKGRNACHRTYCQHCSKYEPRAKVRTINKKKAYNERQRSKY